MQLQNVPENDIWKDDLLGRQEDARFLIDFLSRHSKRLADKGEAKSYVLNINFEWGRGKTFFLQRLQKQLGDEKYLSAYINAWSDDHASDPLVAVIAGIDEALKPFASQDSNIGQVWSAARTSGLKIAGVALAHGTKQILKKAIGEDGVGEIGSIIENSVEAAVDALIDANAKALIEVFSKTKSSVQLFKDNLTKLLDLSSQFRKEPASLHNS